MYLFAVLGQVLAQHRIALLDRASAASAASAASLQQVQLSGASGSRLHSVQDNLQVRGWHLVAKHCTFPTKF